MQEPFWSLPMALAWIICRDAEAVRSQWDSYRKECWDWQHKLETAGRAGSFSFFFLYGIWQASDEEENGGRAAGQSGIAQWLSQGQTGSSGGGGFKKILPRQLRTFHRLLLSRRDGLLNSYTRRGAHLCRGPMGAETARPFRVAERHRDTLGLIIEGIVKEQPDRSPRRTLRAWWPSPILSKSTAPNASPGH